MTEDASNRPEMIRADVAVLKADTSRLREDVKSLFQTLAAYHADNRVEIRNIQTTIGEAVRLLKSEPIAELSRRIDKLDDAIKHLEERQDEMDLKLNLWIGRAQGMGWFGKGLWALVGMLVSGIAIWARWLIAGGDGPHGH